ncbi:M48 family metalloprotease [Streptomyces sp. NPDC047024]|uniref:M48 family metallopeptidase n=1 Tax=Streptomyces sp. NPDC047024 TaxID=3155476 RepID=UPI0033D66213
MTLRFRAFRALVLLVGFFLLGFALLAAMALCDWLLVTHLSSARAAWFAGGVLVLTGLSALVILRGMVTFLRVGRLGPVPEAVRVGPDDHPALWEYVRAAAEAVGERPPDELYLTAEMNAGVSEQSRLLGLLPGRRRMFVGLPLLAGLTGPRLRALLAHEFGHFGHLDTRLCGVVMRGRAAVLHTEWMFGEGSTWLHRAIGGFYARYARVFLRTSQSVARHQEFAADAVAARHAGRDATTALLRSLPDLDAAWSHYLATYAAMGEPVGALPPAGEVYGGFRHLLAARAGDGLAALSAGRRPSRPHPYDSHPPTAERVARIEALPPDGRACGADDEPGALTLLRDADGAFAALEACLLPQASRRMTWEDLVMARAVVDAEGWSRPLCVAVGRALRSTARDADRAAAVNEPDDAGLPELEAVLDAFDQGLLWTEIADRVPKPEQAARLTGSSARNFVRPRIFDGLAGLVHLRLAATGHAGPDIAWSGVPGLALPVEWEKGLDDALDAAVADTPDTAPLRALLARVGPVPV